MTRERWNETRLLALGSTFFALVFSYPLLGHLGTAGLAWDWMPNMQMAWAAWNCVIHLHQFPWWQPWVCGGYPIFAHPESRILTPFFLLHLVFGPAVGLHLEIIAHLALGFAGAFFLARTLEISPIGAVACAGTFMGSSWYYLHLGVGHVMFLGYVYAPWILALFLLDYAVLAALLLALVLYEGGVVYALPHIVLLLAVPASTLAVERRSFRPLLVFGEIVALTLVFSAPKLIAMFVTLRGFDRPWAWSEVNPLPLMVKLLFSPNQRITRTPAITTWNYCEYGAYISPIFAMFALIGAVSNPRRALPWLILTGLLFILAMGDIGDYSPWVLLHSLPFGRDWRLPSRFLIVLTLCVGVLAGFGADQLRDHKQLTVVLLSAALFNCWVVSPPNLLQALEWPTPQSTLTPASFSLQDHNGFIPCEAVRRGAR
jgi:hypothetical protein